jgi:hypothetical protein
MIHLTHHLTGSERDALATANQLLTQITVHHCHNCDCELCEARMLTDVQDAGCFHVRYLPVEVGEN